MSKQISWLREESKRWVERGLITSQQAEEIRRLYPQPKAGLPWSMIIFSGLGATIAGLGVILLMAYNWHAIPKAGKLGIIFAGLVGLHGTGVALMRGERWRQLGEAICLLGTMLFGAGIWLVAQIYHIEEHYPNGFLLWGIGALALAWAMPSLAQALLAVVVLSIWGCAESWGFKSPVHVAPLILLVATGGLAWRMRSPLLLFFVLAGFAFTLCANVSVIHEALLLRVALGFAGAFVGMAVLTRRNDRFPEGAPIWGLFGWFGFLLCVYLLAFPSVAEDLLRGDRLQAQPSVGALQVIYEWLPPGLALLAWAVVAWPFRPGAQNQRRPPPCGFHYWLIPLTVVLCEVLARGQPVAEKWPVASVFNLVFLALAAAWMARGCRFGLVRPTIIGSLLLVALTLARYFDLFESLAVRGLIFLTVGGLLFVEGILFKRARRRAEPQGVNT